MAIYKQVNPLTKIETAYLAGLVDGEGTITLTKRNRGSQRTVVVRIANTELALLEYPLEIIGVGRITSKRTFKENHSPSYIYQLSGRQAIQLLEQLVPYLKSYKRERATLVLRDYIRLTPRNGKYSPASVIEREAFISKFFMITSNKENPHKRVIL